MSDKTYNGWSNYETWNCALWLDNEQHSYTQWHERAQDLYEYHDGDEESAASALAKEIDQSIMDDAPDTYGLYADILHAALREIDFIEIAEHYLSDVEKREPSHD